VTTSTRRVALSLLLPVLALGAACSGSGSDSDSDSDGKSSGSTTTSTTSTSDISSGPTPDTTPIGFSGDVCALLTPEEVASAIGAQVAAPSASGGGGVAICTYEGDAVLVLSVAQFADATAARAQFDANAGIVGTGDDVAGVGDGAYRTNPPTGAPPGYYALEGAFTVGFVPTREVDPATVTTLLNAIFTRLPT
jgi:hypothetical protein